MDVWHGTDGRIHAFVTNAQCTMLTMLFFGESMRVQDCRIWSIRSHNQRKYPVALVSLVALVCCPSALLRGLSGERSSGGSFCA